MQLKEHISNTNKTYKEVAQEIGCSETDIYRYCAGLIIPRPDRMAKITEWSGGEVTANDFYEREN